MVPTVNSNLSAVQAGETAIIQSIHGDPALYHRLVALGFGSGKAVTVVRRGLFRGPMQVRIGMTDVILRLSDADKVELQTTALPAS